MLAMPHLQCAGGKIFDWRRGFRRGFVETLCKYKVEDWGWGGRDGRRHVFQTRVSDVLVVQLLADLRALRGFAFAVGLLT